MVEDLGSALAGLDNLVRLLREYAESRDAALDLEPLVWPILILGLGDRRKPGWR
jgi:hypothetical protein